MDDYCPDCRRYHSTPYCPTTFRERLKEIQGWSAYNTNVGDSTVSTDSKMGAKGCITVLFLFGLTLIVGCCWLTHIPFDGVIYRLMTPRMTGPQVYRIQQRLKNLRFDPGPINGVYGPKTTQAVIGFQRSTALHENGVVDEQTLFYLSYPALRTISKIRGSP